MPLGRLSWATKVDLNKMKSLSKIFLIAAKVLGKPEFWLGVILILAFLARLYKIENPIADWHSWRQADTAAVARIFYREGFNPLLPRYDDMSAVAADSLPNPERYRFVEFPLYNSLVYFSYVLGGGVDERLARLVSIFMSLGSTIFIFLITKKYWGIFTALLSAAIFAFLPFNIYFSRVILPEPTLVFFSLGMFYFTDLWIREDGRRSYFTLSLIFTAIAFLVKPTAVFYLLPLIFVYFKKEQKIWPIPKRYFLWGLLAFAPFVLWRIWILQHPEGIPPSSWLLNGDGIRFKPIFWKWILGERVGKEILTVAGSLLFFVGMIVRPKKNGEGILHLLAVSIFAYLIIFATGNVRHDYYQVLIVPVLAMFTARGFTLLGQGIESFIPRIWTIPIASLLLFLTFYLGWSEVKGLYQINNSVIVDAGKYADKVLPKGAKVVAPYSGDTAFLYQINRSGWPFVPYAVKDMVKTFGATHYVSVNYDSKTNWLMKRYQAVETNPKFVILDLNKLNPEFTLDTEVEPAQ